MEKPYVLGLDMGGTNSVLGVIDARGHVLARTSIKTQEYPDIREYVDALYVEAVKIMEPLGGAEMFRGIGAGAPNSNYYTGNIEYPANLPWQGITPFCELMSARFGLVQVDPVTQERTVKKSGQFYSALISQRAVTQELYDQYVAMESYHH